MKKKSRKVLNMSVGNSKAGGNLEVFLDLETTGFSPTFNEIIEIGAIKFRNGVCVEQFNRRIKPEKYVPLDIQELTGITNEMLKDCEDIKSVLPEFIDFCEDADVYGYNLSFDYNFLCAKAKALGMDFTMNARRLGVDVLKVVKEQHKGFENYKLGTVSRIFKLPFDATQAHTAYYDAYITKLVYNRCVPVSPYLLDKSKYGKPDITATLDFT